MCEGRADGTSSSFLGSFRPVQRSDDFLEVPESTTQVVNGQFDRLGPVLVKKKFFGSNRPESNYDTSADPFILSAQKFLEILRQEPGVVQNATFFNIFTVM